jgi:hypothetical protein
MLISPSKLLLTTLTGFLVLSACSGSQPNREPIAKASTPAAPAQPAAPQAEGDPQKLTADRIMQLQREGYKLVNRDGQTYYCRTEAKTGSHLARDTVCMTEEEIIALRDQTKQGLGRVTRELPPRHGN